jgi:hemerythrin superfamily protein
MDALDLLRSDHDTVRGLFEQFSEAKEADDTDRMSLLQQEIFHELEVHTSIEEEVFYPESKEFGGEAAELIAEGIQEHHVVDQLMSEVRDLSAGAEEWVAKMTVLIENVEHHAEEEEEELFPKLREAFGEERLQAMADKLEAAKQRHEVDLTSRDELYEQAQQLGIEGRSDMSKEELAEAVRGRGSAASG